MNKPVFHEAAAGYSAHVTGSGSDEGLCGPNEYSREQTSLAPHDDVTVLKSSAGFGWTDIYAAFTDERPHMAVHRAIPDIWFATTLTEIDLSREVGDRHDQQSLPANLVSITTPGESVRDEIGSSTRALHVFLKANVLCEVADDLFPRHQADRAIVPAFAADDATLSLLLRTIKAALDEPPGSNRLKIDYLSRALAAHVLQEHSTEGQPALSVRSQEGLGQRQLRLALDFIDENLGRDISISEISAVACLSRALFMRRFKASTGRTPHQYVTEARIRHAKRLIAGSKHELAEIAIICGFASHSHFSAVFKRLAGLSPAAFRRSTR